MLRKPQVAIAVHRHAKRQTVFVDRRVLAEGPKQRIENRYRVARVF